LIEPKGKLFKEDQLHTDRIQDFKVVEDHINEIIREARHEIAILFCNSYTMKMNEIYTILRSLKERANTDILVRILFPKDVDDSLIESYDQVANIRLFERKIEDNNIIIVTDFTRLLVASTIDPVTHNKKTVHLISYFSDERISYAYITTFEKLWLLQTVTQLEVK
jgi:sugar-specific transcriptional regulator TrmB